jgi:hypothetical protein
MLAHWKQGITILLEKIAENTSIDKLRAICLLEADFNCASHAKIWHSPS